MAKDKIAYVCSNCGQESSKWMGKCPSCGQWNTFKEIRIAGDSGSQAAKNAGMTMRHGGAATMFGGQHSDNDAKPMKLRDISAIDEPRIDMRDEELNRVLGGGMVPGSITLLGGEPGIGKSTLTLQTILNMTDRRILYVSGEESAHQIKLRADRLAKGQALLRGEEVVQPFDHITILCETQLEKIFSHIQEVAPEFIVIDSIQTIATEEVDSSPGSVSQVRECAAHLLRFAKTSGIPVILIGHINKEGTLAGPKILEHIVDTVIQFEGDQHYMYRILRSIKNRFGSTSELGIYEMLQGGLRVTDPAMDLSVLAAVLSSNVDTAIEQGWCMAGEVGLSGEVRPVSRIEQRIAEAEKLGFQHIIIPKYNYHGFDHQKYQIEIHPVRKVEEAFRCLFG